jgi:hypothetical protein
VLISCLTHSVPLKMEALCSSEMSGCLQTTTQKTLPFIVTATWTSDPTLLSHIFIKHRNHQPRYSALRRRGRNHLRHLCNHVHSSV